MSKTLFAKRLEISGVVQGVGFRPFVFGLAKKYRLAGSVSNTSEGVFAIVEGTPDNIDAFCREIKNNPPLLATVTKIRQTEIPITGYTGFKIVQSRASDSRTTLISPDVTVCRDCLSEMRDPNDRRYEYPFINCTNCGPRYTIIEDIPYDRPKTSMKQFVMCPDCQGEYDNPEDRRFHAQPNACPLCGPHVFLSDNQGKVVESDSGSAILKAADLLLQGRILAVKGLGGFHLACDATCEAAVQRLRDQKRRPHKPFALMAKGSSDLFAHVHLNDEEKTVLHSYHRPIVLLKKKPQADTSAPIAPQVAPLNHFLGVMLPYTPLHELLLEKGPDILVMTSGNRSGEPLSIDNNDAVDAFSHIADSFLLHNRDIYFRADDSIARVQRGKQRFIRRSRGYAPLPLFYDKALPPILACGAGLKNTVCLTRDNYLFLSQHIGDLANVKIHDFFTGSIEHLKQILDIHPGIVAHDLHPGLMSTQYAKGLEGVEKIGIQHHHAHAVACMAENNLDRKTIAITLDGTGLGTDNTIWGGEILVSTLSSFERAAHLTPIEMPGGDAAVLEPWRMAAAVLYRAFGEKTVDLDIPYMEQTDRAKLEFIVQMIQKKLNTPMTSSCGRLFDAVSSLLCIRHAISHEGQAAMELEAVADPDTSIPGYEFELIRPPEPGPLEICLLPAIRQMVRDIQTGIAVSRISAAFHQTIVDAFAAAALRISEQTRIRDVVLSGGVFNNDILFNAMADALEQNGLTVYTHSMVPAGDGGISYGQAIAAAAIKGKI